MPHICVLPQVCVFKDIVVIVGTKNFNVYLKYIFNSLLSVYRVVARGTSRRKQHATYYVWSLADFFLPCPDGMWVSHRLAVQESTFSFFFILASLVTGDFRSRCVKERKKGNMLKSSTLTKQSFHCFRTICDYFDATFSHALNRNISRIWIFK